MPIIIESVSTCTEWLSYDETIDSDIYNQYQSERERNILVKSPIFKCIVVDNIHLAATFLSSQVKITPF